MFSFGLAGKTALVTGASSGLGAHFARVLAREGVQVTLAARRPEALAEVANAITHAGGDARVQELDVADNGSVARAFEGQPPFDIVVNNAGTTETDPIVALDLARWNRVIQTNLTGPFLVAQAAARTMIAAGQGGAIVNVASILGRRVASQVAGYATSKAGLVQLTRGMALEWARHGIRVNALCPGYVETPLNADFFATEAGRALVRRIPARRLSQPEDLDGALLLLCSDAGRMITGSELVVDGGHLVSSL